MSKESGENRHFERIVKTPDLYEDCKHCPLVETALLVIFDLSLVPINTDISGPI